MKKQLFISFCIVVFIALATTAVILYGKGYRFGLDTAGKPDFFGTGLLAVNSTPEGAEVFINGHLTTATNNTVNLAPGKYDVKIYQDGYFPWEKNITIQKEVVSKADALLFPNAPKLESITDTGVSHPVIDPSFTKIAFTASPSADPKKNGVFVLDTSNRPLLTLQGASTQIVDDTIDSDFSTAALSWSPDGKNLLASISANRQNPTDYLLDATNFNQTPQDVTETLSSVTASWQKEKTELQTVQLDTLKSPLKKFMTANTSILAWSPDETKILYKASQSATMPIIINPPIIGADTTPEERSIQPGNVYVYDTKEDKNFKILDAQTAGQDTDNGQIPLQWLPDSAHLIYTHDKQIEAMDYDGQNIITIYAGPFVDHYVFPWPDGSKIVILTNFNNNQIPPNLYTISLK